MYQGNLNTVFLYRSLYHYLSKAKAVAYADGLAWFTA